MNEKFSIELIKKEMYKNYYFKVFVNCMKVYMFNKPNKPFDKEEIVFKFGCEKNEYCFGQQDCL